MGIEAPNNHCETVVLLCDSAHCERHIDIFYCYFAHKQFQTVVRADSISMRVKLMWFCAL